jgi:hypothetical protein
MSEYGHHKLIQDKLDATLLWSSNSVVFSGTTRAKTKASAS